MRKSKDCFTVEDANSSFTVDIGSKRACVLMSYALQHGGGLSKGALTNWVLEGKLHHTDDSWCLLSEHVNDLRLSCNPTHGRAIGLWPLAVCGPFRYIRVRLTGSNSNGRHVLAVSGMELYGALIRTNDGTRLTTDLQT